KVNGLVETPDTCPVMGLTGYGGICDPTGNAGCNLPIYGIGPTTEFTDVDGLKSTYAPATVKWSGYVKSWAIISKSHFMSEIKGREEIYLTDDLLNENQIMRITRSLDYCDGPELTSAAHLALPAPQNTPDLSTCTQYMQYQQTDVEKNIYRWVDLYFPPPDQDPQLSQARIDVLYTNHFNKDGTLGKKVDGTGDNRYMPGYDPKSPIAGFVSFLDDKSGPSGGPVQYQAADGTYNDAIVHVPPIVTKESFPTIGQVQKDGNGNDMWMTDANGKLLYDANGNKIPVGVAYSVDRGTKSAIRMHNKIMLNGKATTCAFLDAGAPTSHDDMSHPPKIFVPTNSQAEMQHFIDALSAGKSSDAGVAMNGATIRDCTTKFAQNTTDTRPPAKDGSNVRKDAKGNTWWGKVSCQELIGANQPSCNQTKPVSLERMCQYENGMFGDCEACSGVPEPDGAGMASTYAMWDKWWQTGDEAADTDIMVAPEASGSKGDRCRFIANCFAVSAQNGGCPSDGTVGGHVFCLSGDTKITMADGSQKAIKKVKAGEKVMSFNAKNSRNAALETAPVKATAITKKQKIVKINNLRITPLHKIVLASGRAVEAQDIKVGDKILKDNGMVEVVTKVQTNLEPITVYNLVLENGSDGYIAGGVRVMSYPTPKGMDIASKKGAARNVSSLKH
ncbi:MAG: Hint domain-containing protein, partial [Bdellovibrionota bacterium]